MLVSNQIPEPKDLSDDDLLRLLDSDDQSGYRVPMSIGDAHTEVDNSECFFPTAKDTRLHRKDIDVS